jgi:hypothetical protein
MKPYDVLLLLGLLCLLVAMSGHRGDQADDPAASYTTGTAQDGAQPSDGSLDDCGNRHTGVNSLGHVCGPIDVFGFRKRGW